jgi:hypothetical protein
MPYLFRIAILLLLGTLGLALAGCGDWASEPPAEPNAADVVEPEAPATQTESLPAEEEISPPEEVAPPKEAAAPEPEPAPQPEPEFEFETLQTRLRETKALGVFTKLEIKDQISSLLDKVRKRHETGTNNWSDLREAFDLLVLKVMTLLQDQDAELASELARARESLWAVLADPVRFAKLEAI